MRGGCDGRGPQGSEAGSSHPLGAPQSLAPLQRWGVFMRCVQALSQPQRSMSVNFVAGATIPVSISR